MPSSIFSFDKTDHNIKVKDSAVTTSFDSSKGVVTVSTALRNPRMVNARYRLFYTLSGGSETQVTTYPDTAPIVFNTSPSFTKLKIEYEIYKDLVLDNHGTVAFRFVVFDNGAVGQDTNANKVVNHTFNLDIDLEPKVKTVIEPQDFGEGGASDFIFKIPYLKRSQKVVPSLKVSTNADMSSSTTYSNCKFVSSSTNTINGFEDAGSGQTTIRYTKIVGDDLQANDTVSVTESQNYDGTYTVQSVTLTGSPAGNFPQINVTKAIVAGTDAETGLLFTSNPNNYGSSTTSGQTIPSSQTINYRFKVLQDNGNQISLAADSYYTIQLNCVEPT